MSDIMPSLLTATTGLMNALSPNLALSLCESLNAEVLLEVGQVEAVAVQELLGRAEDTLWTVFNLSSPQVSECVLLIPEPSGLAIATLLAGDIIGGEQESLTSDDIAKLTQVSDGLVRGLAVSLGNMNGELIEVEACTTTQGALSLPPVFALEQSAIQVTFHLTLPDAKVVSMTMLFTPDFAQTVSTPAESEDDGQVLGEDELAAMLSELEGMGGPTPTLSGSVPSGGNGGSNPPFANFPSAPGDNSNSRGLELLLDIPLDVTVELGRVRMLIKDVLDLASGSVVELDRVAGEPVDLLVNGRLVARGEVVVIEDNFGIRLTEIVSPADRVAGLGKGR